MHTTFFTCYKNTKYKDFLLFLSEKSSMTVPLKDSALLAKLFYKKMTVHQELCRSSRLKSLKKGFDPMKYEKTCSFYVQSGRGRKRVDSMVVEEVTTAVL